MVALFSTTEQRISLRPDVVVHIYPYLEWLQHSAFPLCCYCSWCFDPDRCLRILGLQCCFQSQLATITMAQGVDRQSYHDKGTCPHCVGYRSLGTPAGSKGGLGKSDNLNVVTAINKGSCREAVVMHLLRCMWFFVAHFDIRVVAEHLAGKDNTIADQISGNDITQMRRIHAGLSRWPTLVPTPILHMISPKGLDWVSLHFC